MRTPSRPDIRSLLRRAAKQPLPSEVKEKVKKRLTELGYLTQKKDR